MLTVEIFHNKLWDHHCHIEYHTWALVTGREYQTLQKIDQWMVDNRAAATRGGWTMPESLLSLFVLQFDDQIDRLIDSRNRTVLDY
jgi:hypothetical protein